MGRGSWSRFVLAFALMSCASAPSPSEKITFDLTEIDADGLLRPPAGPVAVAYEFCAPDRPDALAAVRRIDPHAKVSSSPGRSGCSEDEVLVISTTHQPAWRAVLDALAALSFVTEISRTYWE